jgi:hypothetical protein
LTFYASAGGLPAWRAWIAPDGTSHVDEVPSDVVGKTALRPLTSANGFADERLHVPVRARAGELEQLGRALLPQGLQAELGRPNHGRPPRIVIVPDGPFAYIPWAALHVDGRLLVERAVLQIAPALELTGHPPAPRRPRARRLVAHVLTETVGELAELRERDAVDLRATRGTFVAALDTNDYAGAYLRLHGDGLGLRQAVAFADGSELSAAGALTTSWPPWVVVPASSGAPITSRAASRSASRSPACCAALKRSWPRSSS